MTSATEEERQSLLSDHQSARSFSTSASHRSPFKEHWPVFRVLISALLFQVAFYTYSAKATDSSRAYICASYYAQHRELQAPSERPCQVPAIESKFARSDSTLQLIAEIFNTAAILLLVPVLSRGRKRMTRLFVCGGIISILPYMTLPFGYPFAPRDAELIVDPRRAYYVIAAAKCIDSAAGSVLLSLMVFRSMAIDVAPPARRTTYIAWISAVNSMGIFIGPILAGLLTEVLPPIPVEGQSLISAIMRLVGRHPRVPPIASPLPGTDPDMKLPPKDDPTNVMPFYLGLVLYIATGLWVAFVVPETAVAATSHTKVSTEEDSSTPSQRKEAKQSKNPLDILRVIGPRRRPNGRWLDWRMPLIGLAGHLSTAASAGWNAEFYFLGYKLAFGAERLGLFLSFFGASRTITLLALPVLVAFLNRVLPRPAELRGLNDAQMATLSERDNAKMAAPDVAGNPMPDEEHHLGSDAGSHVGHYGSTIDGHDDEGEGGNAGSSRVSVIVDDLYRQEDNRGSAYGLQGVHRIPSTAPSIASFDQGRQEDDKVQRSQLRALSRFRATRDLLILRCAYFFDISGWLIMGWAAYLLSVGTIIAGTLVAALGAVGSSVMLSIAITVRLDQQEDEEQDDRHTDRDAADETQGLGQHTEERARADLKRKEVRQQLTDRVVGAMGFLDQLAQLWGQPLVGIVYGMTVANYPYAIFVSVASIHAISLMAVGFVWI